MSEWKEIELGQIADITSSKRIFYADYVESGIPFYRSKEIINKYNRQEISNELFITEEKFEEIKDKHGVPQENDILLTSVGTLGIPYLVKADDKFYFKDGNLTWFRNINQSLIDIQFLYTWFQSRVGRQKLDEITIGSTQPALTIRGLKTVEIPLPPLPEQRAIAEVLSSLDDKIDLLHRQNQTLEQMAETLFRQWFVEEVDEGWEEVTLKNLCKVITKGTTPTSLKRQFNEVGINFIKVNCIDDNGNFLYNKFNFIDDETHHVALKRSILEEGDLLYSIAGTIGRISEVTHEVLPANVNQALAILRVNTDIINPYYVKYSLKDPNITFDLHSKIVHAVQPNLSLGEIGSTLIPLPDKKTRQKFKEVINPIQAKIKSNQTQIRTLTALRDTLLPKLMSGEVRVELE